MGLSIKDKVSEIKISSLTDSGLSEFIDTNYKNNKKIIIVDENTQEHCLPTLLNYSTVFNEAEIITVPSGEESKSMDLCIQVWEGFTEYHIKRNDIIINLGGGMITDLGGFIASLYKRGVAFINIPTSLLAMVDASVGGKTGIDLGPYKNQIGVFSFPELVICDPEFLETLPDAEFLSGKAEMLKHAILTSKEMWEKVKTLTAQNISTEIIKESIEVKHAIVLKDPKENGERKKLNVGHTIGHAIEGFMLERAPVKHGYCVAWGLLVEARLAYAHNFLASEVYEEIKHVITSCFSKLEIVIKDIDTLINLLWNDKKNDSEEINFNLIEGFGKIKINHTFSEASIKKALEVELC